jgi:hypothetical protein
VFEPANLGTKGQHATSRPPKPLPCTFTLYKSQLTFLLLLLHRSPNPATNRKPNLTNAKLQSRASVLQETTLSTRQLPTTIFAPNTCNRAIILVVFPALPQPRTQLQTLSSQHYPTYLHQKQMLSPHYSPFIFSASRTLLSMWSVLQHIISLRRPTLEYLMCFQEGFLKYFVIIVHVYVCLGLCSTPFL